MPHPPRIKRQAATQQQRDLDPLIARAEIAVRAAFDQARRDVQPVLDGFASAMQAEYDRLNRDRDEDDDEEPPKPVPHSWLLTSGWQKHVTQAIAHAADQAAAHCERAVLTSQKQAATLGAAHGRELVKQAMQPAVDAYVKAAKAGRIKTRRKRRPLR